MIGQGTIRKKEEELTGAIWDCLPVTEKTKDEINFGQLGEEVRQEFSKKVPFTVAKKGPITFDRMEKAMGEILAKLKPL